MEEDESRAKSRKIAMKKAKEEQNYGIEPLNA